MARTRYLFFVGLAALAIALGVWLLGPERRAPPSGAPMVDVEVPDLVAAEENGRGVFVANCASCHGETAGGREGLGPPLVHVIYEPSHHGDAAFMLAAKNGVRQHHWNFGDMPPVETVSEAQINAIVAYVRALQRANGIY